MERMGGVQEGAIRSRQSGPPSCRQTYHTPPGEEASSGQERHVKRRPKTQAAAALYMTADWKLGGCLSTGHWLKKNHTRTATFCEAI